MRVRDAMTREVATVAVDAPLGDAAQTMAERGVSGLPVVDGDRLVGVVSEQDVLKLLRTRLTGLDTTWLPSPFDLIEIPIRAAVERVELAATTGDVKGATVAEAMTRGAITATPDEGVELAAARMAERDVNRLPVVEDGRLVGILTRGDVVRAMAREAAADARRGG